jgi:hypothetical protein
LDRKVVGFNQLPPVSVTAALMIVGWRILAEYWLGGFRLGSWSEHPLLKTEDLCCETTLESSFHFVLVFALP